MSILYKAIAPKMKISTDYKSNTPKTGIMQELEKFLNHPKHPTKKLYSFYKRIKRERQLCLLSANKGKFVVKTSI